MSDINMEIKSTFDGELNIFNKIIENDYEKLINLPSINGVELMGNKTGEELGLVPDLSGYATKDEIPVVPESLPNPNALKFTGAVNAVYDGSSAVSVEIPSGGGGGTDISLGLTSASVGQIVKVKAVDENGKPTEWEAAEMDKGEPSFPKFEKLLTHTITEEEIAANPVAFVWGTAQIPNLNDFNVFTLTIRNPDNTTKITFTKWVRLKINTALLGSICGLSSGARVSYSISANRLYGHWVSENIYNPQNSTGTVLTPPYSNTTLDTTLAASEAVTSIGFTSYGGDYGLTAGIIVEIWGAK